MPGNAAQQDLWEGVCGLPMRHDRTVTSTQPEHDRVSTPTFNNVSHFRLLHNLRKRRIHERTVRWIASFLADRSTVISFDASKSEFYETTTGIPQGSPLSPILYLFHNMDLVETCNQEPNTIAMGSMALVDSSCPKLIPCASGCRRHYNNLRNRLPVQTLS